MNMLIQGLVACIAVIIPTVVTLYTVKGLPIIRAKKQKNQIWF